MGKIKNLDHKEVTEILKESKVKILDVRTLEEFEEGAFPGAQLLPVDELAANVHLLPQDKSAPIMVYCAHGMRSLRAADFLRSLGYTQILNVKAGYCGYVEENEE